MVDLQKERPVEEHWKVVLLRTKVCPERTYFGSMWRNPEFHWGCPGLCRGGWRRVRQCWNWLKHNISNTRERVSSGNQTPKRALKKRRAPFFFSRRWGSSRTMSFRSLIQSQQISLSFVDLVSSSLQKELKLHYNSLSELLRHFWSCFPVKSQFLEEKVSEYAVTCWPNLCFLIVNHFSRVTRKSRRNEAMKRLSRSLSLLETGHKHIKQ